MREILNIWLPRIGAERSDRYSAVYTWGVPQFGECREHWGLPLSTHDPFVALYFKAIYAGRGIAIDPQQLSRAMQISTSFPDELATFCDPLTWRFWLNPFGEKLTPENDVGAGLAAELLRSEILANRHRGYVSSAVRQGILEELAALRESLLDAERTRVNSVQLGVDAFSVLAASADLRALKITLSDTLVRHAFVRVVVDRRQALERIHSDLRRSGDRIAAAKAIRELADETVDAVRRSLSFILAHELAHLFVPTLEEPEADCYGLAAVVATRREPELGVFRDVRAALIAGKDDYWNGLPTHIINLRFDLLEVWIAASKRGVPLRDICLAAWAR